MPSRITSQQYGHAVLSHVQTGAYPESEDIVSAELPPSALPEVSKLIAQAREDVKSIIKKASNNSAPDIDGWISQAKQLRVDILKSQEIARSTVEEARRHERLEEQVSDAANKVRLLDGEVHFNTVLGEILERLQATRGTLNLVQRATSDGRLSEAVNLIMQADEELSSTPVSQNTTVAGVLAAKITELRKDVVERLTCCWQACIHVDMARPSIRIKTGLVDSSSMDLETLTTATTKLKFLDSVLLRFSKDIETIVIQPRLEIKLDGTVSSLIIDGDEIRVAGKSSDSSAQALFADLDSIIDFLCSRLPLSVVEPLAGFLMPPLIASLISTWLAPAVPEDLDKMGDFESVISLVSQFSTSLDSYNWHGKNDLVAWTKSIPSIWLRKRQESCLNYVRSLLSQGIEATQTVERVETQVLPRNDEVFAGNGGGDDWNAGWSDEESSSPTKASHLTTSSKASGAEDEEDVSAWGLDDDKVHADNPDEQQGPVAADDEEADAWGWGDDEDAKKHQQHPQADPNEAMSNGPTDVSRQPEREITLKETYNITSLPKEILEIITQIVSDARKLESPELAHSPMASAGQDLLSLPGLILAMYRAGASTSYASHPSGSMFLYNDSLWLAERLQKHGSHRVAQLGKYIQSPTTYNLDLGTHISALEKYGKRAYAKEMESQRTIITDLLDGAQGFAHCTEHPFSQECDIAIASTVDRLRGLHKQWKDVLSHSALLQSLGSLLSTVTNKIVVDIEDMSDIAEPESQQLTAYCNRIAALEILFVPSSQAPSNTAATSQAQNEEQKLDPLTALYTPHWLKFQYLTNILESSLVDIKYLWTEGELGLEFDTEELVDLVVALFADSPYRRSAVAEIRGRRGVR